MGMDTGRALNPDELRDYKVELIPPVVFEVFNKLIAEKLVNKTSTVLQSDVVNELEGRGLNRQEIFARGWLDIEPYYEKQGWNVSYDKPGYNESYIAFWKFTVK